MSSATHPIGIIGAGTMGAGIAQVAASRGWLVYLLDISEAAILTAIDGIKQRLQRQVEKGSLTSIQRDEIVTRIRVTSTAGELKDCDLVIEAIVENLEAKTRMLTDVIHALPQDAVIASNTSSLSISKLGESLGQPQRVIGMHFFNPAPLMPLVEIVHGARSSPHALERATLIAEAWGKTVVHCRDTPGFIVNRVARPYYLEGFRIFEDGYAGAEEIDKTMRELGGFKMGPLELTDLIGQDINLATTVSLYEQLGKPARLRPSDMQTRLVHDGHLGRKSKRGVYNYELESGPPVQVPRKTLVLNDRLSETIDAFTERATDQIGTDVERYIFARILITIINEAAWALEDRVATASDINTAMKLGTNYPKGPLEWADEIGYATCGQLLEALHSSVEARFDSPELLKSKV